MASNLRCLSLMLMWMLLTVSVAPGSVLAAPLADDRITNLPGLPQGANLTMYSGSVLVDATANRQLFYWFIQSQRDAAKDPLVLWLNGGPGCSSLSGLLSENGPFWPGSDGVSLELNKAGWTAVANVIWLESPAGVGFSFSDRPSDYTTGDKATADDAYAVLQEFFRRHPEFVGRDFYVSGESYGGHYVPNLSLRILEGNQDPKSIPIKLVGFMVGNPWTVAALDNAGTVEFWYEHGIISNSTYQGAMATCPFDRIGPLALDNGTDCSGYLTQAAHELRADSHSAAAARVSVGAHIAQRLNALRSDADTAAVAATDPTPPCVDAYVTKYLNRPDVQAALHVPRATKWSICSALVNYSYADLLSSELPVYKQLIAAGLRILVYSGDVDGIVPFTGTRRWLAALQLNEAVPMRPWTVDRQVGGWVTEYKELTFATVRYVSAAALFTARLRVAELTAAAGPGISGAGHMVPGTQPDRALAMVSRFLAGQPL